MSQHVEFCFDFVSPMSYFAYVQLPALKQRTGAVIEFTPVFLGGIMQATGNQPPGRIQAKGAYMMKDFQRLAARFDVPFGYNPAFPMNTLSALRMAVGLKSDPLFGRFTERLFHHTWVEPKNIADAEVLNSALADDGFDVPYLLELAAADENKAQLQANTEHAIKGGAFGAPTFFVAGHMYFGQDRLDQVEAALKGEAWAMV